MSQPPPVEPTTDLDSPAGRRSTGILRARARELARLRDVETPTGKLDVLTFSLGDEHFALEARYVRGLFRVSTLSLLPAEAAPFLGVTEWQGDLLTVLDLRAALGYDAMSLHDRAFGLALGEGSSPLGILVDAVDSYCALPALLDPGASTMHATHFIRGVTPDAIVLLDAAALLDAYQSTSTLP